jgi:hypothetical protein
MIKRSVFCRFCKILARWAVGGGAKRRPDLSGSAVSGQRSGLIAIIFAKGRVFFAKIRINIEKNYGNRIRKFKRNPAVI